MRIDHCNDCGRIEWNYDDDDSDCPLCGGSYQVEIQPPKTLEDDLAELEPLLEKEEKQNGNQNQSTN